MAYFKKYILFIPVTLWLLIILILSGYPGKQLPEIAVWQIDKFVHTFIYGVLSLCLCFSFLKQFLDRKKRSSIAVKIIAFGIFYGGFMEILQNNMFINRSGNWYDFFANALGAILGVVIFPLLVKYLPLKKWFKRI